MNRIAAALTLIGCSAFCAQAFADDTVSRATPNDHQILKDCIEKQKTADVTMSEAQMERICKDRLKAQKRSGTPMEPAATDTPHN